MPDKDVTKLVEFDNNDDEALPVTRCACGERFEPWEFTIGIYRENAYACTKCGRAFYFELAIQVYEVEKE